MLDAQILAIAKRTLNQGLTHQKITPCTDFELLNFARKVMESSPEIRRYRWLLEQYFEYKELGASGVERAIDEAMSSNV